MLGGAPSRVHAPIPSTAGFQMGGLRERDGRGETRKLFLPGAGELSAPTEGTLVLLSLGDLLQKHTHTNRPKKCSPQT